jgi:hypothetical protein
LVDLIDLVDLADLADLADRRRDRCRQPLLSGQVSLTLTSVCGVRVPKGSALFLV